MARSAPSGPKRVAVTSVLLVYGALIAGAVAAAQFTSLSYLPLTALLLVLARPALDRAGRFVLGDRAPGASAWALGAQIPFLLWLTLEALDVVKIETSDLWLFSPLYLFLAAWAAVSWGSSRPAQAACARLGRLLPGLFALAVGLGAVAAVRAARHPDLARYAGTLPAAQEIAVSASSRWIADKQNEIRVLRGPAGEGALRVHRACWGGSRSCFWEVTPEVPAWAEEGVQAGSWQESSFRHDAVHRLWCELDAPKLPLCAREGGEFTRLTAGDIPSARLSAPPSFIGAAWLGVALAVPWWIRYRRRRASLLDIEGLRPGILDAEGWVELEGGSPRARVQAQPIEPGPVLALVRAPSDGGPYRDQPLVVVRYLSGKKDDLVAAARAEAADACALALMAVIVPLTPLAGALLAGL